MSRVQLTPVAAAAVRRGHPWVWREAVARPPRGAITGTAVELCDDANNFLGRALWDVESPIAARVYLRDAKTALDARAIGTLVDRAATLRERLFTDGATTAYRLCNGEGDRVPALVLDRYDSVAVLRLDGALLDPWLDRLVPVLASLLTSRGVTTLGVRVEPEGPGGARLRTLHGPPPPDRLVVLEHGMRMEVDLARGQKTGAFLDQRDNRARVRALSAGRDRVLNLFSYAGGFSVAARSAARVTSPRSTPHRQRTRARSAPSARTGCAPTSMRSSPPTCSTS